MPVKGVYSPTEMLGVGWGLPLQCSSLYEERYVLPSQTLNSQGSSPVQETHPLLGEWKVSTPMPHAHAHWTASGQPHHFLAPLPSSSDPLTPTPGGWEGTYLPLGGRSPPSQEVLKQPFRVL